MKVKEAILLLCVVFAPVVAEAQVPVRDNEKKKQWQSMENGPWDFAPDWYYYFLHKGYSGAEMYWKWAGFKSGFRIRFKESKSNIKRIMPTRVISEETQRQKLEKVEEERKYVEELYKEELVREADAPLTWSIRPTRTSSTVCRTVSRTDCSTVCRRVTASSAIRWTN